MSETTIECYVHTERHVRDVSVETGDTVNKVLRKSSAEGMLIHFRDPEKNLTKDEIKYI